MMEKGKRIDYIQSHLRESSKVKALVSECCADDISSAASLIAKCFRGKGKLLLCGNGGSAADCQHFAAEFVSRLTKDFERPALPAIALTTDTSFLTAYTNDVSFDGVFDRQVEALGKPGDVLFGISTSGNSGNVIKAFERAQSMGIETIALCGEGGKLPAMATVSIRVPSHSTQHIQESHLAIYHILCAIVERELFQNEPQGGIVV